MENSINFKEFVSEDLKQLGRLKIPANSSLRDPGNSHRFKERGLNRKNLRQIPDKYKIKKTSLLPQTVTGMVHSLDLSARTVDIAKRAPSGVWRISKQEVLDIARKYKFIVPNDHKPMKHLGSTGIQLIRFKPGVFYLYKPRKHRKRKKRSPFTKDHSKIIKGVDIT